MFPLKFKHAECIENFVNGADICVCGKITMNRPHTIGKEKPRNKNRIGSHYVYDCSCVCEYIIHRNFEEDKHCV